MMKGTMNRVNRAFTLVEILIVVVILGILAAIVIPQFTNASEEASTSSLMSQLQTVRSQIELYRVKNNGDVPLLVTDGWDVFTEALDANGDPAPYLQAAPANPFNSMTDVVDGDSTQADWYDAGEDTAGWVYDEATGEIAAVGFDEANQNYIYND